MLVVDTSVLIEHLGGNQEATGLLRREGRQASALVPTLVAWELWKGAETPREREDVEALLGSLRSDPFTDAVARLAGELHLAHRRQGKERPEWDLLIAAHALHHGVPLATADKDFDAMDGLELVRVPVR